MAGGGLLHWAAATDSAVPHRQRGNPVIEGMVKEACHAGDWKFQTSGEGFMVMVPVRDGRQQEVIVARVEDETPVVIRFTTVIGPVKDLTGNRPHSALRLNYALRGGAFAIHGESLVLCRLQLLADLDAKEACRTITYLAEEGDRYEEHVYGTDVH